MRTRKRELEILEMHKGGRRENGAEGLRGRRRRKEGEPWNRRGRETGREKGREKVWEWEEEY